MSRPSELAGKSFPGLHGHETHNQNSVLWGWVGLSNREGETFGNDVWKASSILLNDSLTFKKIWENSIMDSRIQYSDRAQRYQ
jgi:hypothetical protein